MPTRLLLLALGLLVVATAAGGQPLPLMPPVAPPPAAPSPAQEKRLKEMLAELVALQKQIDDLRTRVEADMKKAAGPHYVGRVLVVGFAPQDEPKVLAIVEKAGLRPGLTIRDPAVEEVRGRLLTAGLKCEVTVLPGEAESQRRDVRVRSAR